MYSTRTRAHPQRTSSRGKWRACRTKVCGQVGEDRRACPARGELNGPRAPRQADCSARRLPHEDPRAEVGEEVRVGVGVGVRVGPVEFKLYGDQLHLWLSVCVCVCVCVCLGCDDVDDGVVYSAEAAAERAVFCRRHLLRRLRAVYSRRLRMRRRKPRAKWHLP